VTSEFLLLLIWHARLQNYQLYCTSALLTFSVMYCLCRETERTEPVDDGGRLSGMR